MRILLLLALGSACRPALPAEAAYVQAIRDEHRALSRTQALLGWYRDTQGQTSLSSSGPDRLSRKAALDAISRARAGASGNDALALLFLQRALTRELVALSTDALDQARSAAEADATVRLPWRAEPVAFRDAEGLIAQEPDADRRREAFLAVNAVRIGLAEPLAERREAAAQRAAREAGFADSVAFAEDQRQVDLDALLASGIAYVQATEGIFRATLDRVAREELGLPREALHCADWLRLWKAPRLARYFDRSLELGALQAFLSGIGLDLRTAGGSPVQIDDSALPRKRPRAFVVPVDAPFDVRLSVKPAGGLDDYWSLFHEAGHAVHFASAAVAPEELVTEGYGAPAEAFGEFFRQAFSDGRWLLRYRDFLKSQGRPLPGDAELSAIVRRTALAEMAFLRNYAFARIAYGLRLHGRPASEIRPALALLPAPDAAAASLPELYRQLFSVASGFALDPEEAQPFDADDSFASADYARAFVLAGMMHDAIRERFGADWPLNPEVGRFLRKQLFAPGTSLSADEVALRLGFSGLDFGHAARRAARLVAEADALEEAK